MGMAQQLDEPLDARIPEAFVAAKPVIGASEGPRIDAAVVDATAHGALDKPGALERLDVLGGCGERHPVRRCQLPDGVLALGEALEHRTAGRVAEGAKDEVEACVMMFNHMVEDSAAPRIVNYPVE